MKVYSTKYPLLLIPVLTAGVLFALFVVFNGMGFFGIILYPSAFFVVLWMFFLRYACRVSLTDSAIEVKYFFPIHTDRQFSYASIVSTELWDSMTFEFCDESTGPPIWEGLYYHNRLFLTLENGETVCIRIHTRYGKMCPLYRDLMNNILRYRKMKRKK
jgi:hypothetical protein